MSERGRAWAATLFFLLLSVYHNFFEFFCVPLRGRPYPVWYTMSKHLLSLALLSLALPFVQSLRLASANWTVGLEFNVTLNTVIVTELTFFSAGAFTVSLAMQPGYPGFDYTASSTILLENKDGSVTSTPATCGASPCTITASPDGLTLTATGLTHAGLDQETWTVSLSPDGATLQWLASRTTTQPHTLLSDRLALVFETIGYPPIHGNQIPSWLDTGMRFNESAGAGFALGEGQYEFLSGPSQTVKWAPTGALMAYTGVATATGAAAPALTPAFSYAKPAMDGTSRTVSLGVQAVGGRADGSAVALPTGATLTRSFSLAILPPEAPSNFPTLNFTLPSNPKFEGLLREFASVQNMFEGFFFGNNPASVVCLHEMGWFPLIQSIYPAGSIGLEAVAREFEYFGTCGWDNGALRNGTDSPYVSCTPGNGGMVHRLASNGFYNAPWGQLQDQNPHFIIGVHALALASGDKAAATRLLPAVLLVADYLEANGLATTGIFTSPASGIANGGACSPPPSNRGEEVNGSWVPSCGSSNWFDVVLQGHFVRTTSFSSAAPCDLLLLLPLFCLR